MVVLQRPVHILPIYHKVSNFLGFYFWVSICLSSTLDWSRQISEVCLRANRKLSVLRSVKLLSRQTLDILYKLTVRSIIDYALPVYCTTLKQTELSRLDNIQYRAAKLVTGAFHLTSRYKLNTELGWENIRKRCDVLSLNIFHKIHRYETSPLIPSCMPIPDIEQRYPSRSKGGYILELSQKPRIPDIQPVIGKLSDFT